MKKNKYEPDRVIYKRYMNGEKVKDIAKDNGVSQSTIYHAINRAKNGHRFTVHYGFAYEYQLDCAKSRLIFWLLENKGEEYYLKYEDKIDSLPSVEALNYWCRAHNLDYKEYYVPIPKCVKRLE